MRAEPLGTRLAGLPGKAARQGAGGHNLSAPELKKARRESLADAGKTGVRPH
ncbi:hypothetical protein CLOLEP_00206 [[Clostridium] leptum DSM 753]|uniref:Uncharacterized protein n=1 Tax=[Clostridium] leptum DSM 753 TaxID=428125 RepID=A7VNT0_9FIRM|nr:hypothetical protein CLOLEP_00206 [[Clostridium] leptum DSM 753]